MKRLLVVAVVALNTHAFIVTERAAAQSISEVLRKEAIPKGFKTYSVFLVCNPQWLVGEKSADLYDLYRQFRTFGRTIGDDHVAVWFWQSESYASDPALAQHVDVERSVRFCKAWKLKPSAGPHLVVTSTYPDESDLSSGLPKNRAVYGLGNISPGEISDLLARLTDQLVEKGHVDEAAASRAPVGLWVRLLEATQRTINSFGCAWSFSIDAGPVKANLHSCQAQ